MKPGALKFKKNEADALLEKAEQHLKKLFFERNWRAFVLLCENRETRSEHIFDIFIGRNRLFYIREEGGDIFFTGSIHPGDRGTLKDFLEKFNLRITEIGE